VLGIADGTPERAKQAQHTLRSVVGNRMDSAKALGLVAHAALALQPLHLRGAAAGNVKPERFAMLEEGAMSLVTASTSSPAFDPYYAAPEVALGKPPSPASDMYSLGVILYELLTQRLPYMAESKELLLAQHAHADVPQLPKEHAGLQALADQLLAKSPAARVPHAGKLLSLIAALRSPTARA
jgi:serine/threonine protein kinase